MKRTEYAAPLVAVCKWKPRWPCASTKNLDLVWVWFYKDVALTALFKGANPAK